MGLNAFKKGDQVKVKITGRPDVVKEILGHNVLSLVGGDGKVYMTDDLIFIAPEPEVEIKPLISSEDFLLSAIENQKQKAAIRDTSKERSMEKIVKAFNIIYDKDLTTQQGWEFMCLLKQVRAAQGDYHEDDHIDKVSYASLAAEEAANAARS